MKRFPGLFGVLFLAALLLFAGACPQAEEASSGDETLVEEASSGDDKLVEDPGEEAPVAPAEAAGSGAESDGD